jgi:glycosyltransferase involved in cell wall biosynthesis
VKILLLCHSLSIGGTERQLVVLAKGLRLRGHDVTVMVFYGNGALESELRDQDIPVLDLGKAGRWDALPFFIRSVRAIRRLQPATIYGFLGTPNLLACLLRLFAPGAAVVWGVRAARVDLDRYDWLTRWLYRLECSMSRFADLVICNSRAGLQYAVAHGFPSRKMIVIPNGIDVERFHPDARARSRLREEWGVADDEVLIGLVGRLDPMKDHHTFLRAAAVLMSEQPQARFICVGDGPEAYASELHRLAGELAVDRKLIWVNARRDVSAVFNALDITCLSSSGEGFPNVVAESMACGVPCVVTDVGDAAFIVGVTGEVVPPMDPGALARGLSRLMGRLGPDLKRAARAAVVERFTEDRLVVSTEVALDRLR